MPVGQMANEYDQLVSMVNQLLDERDKLSRENEYLKAKLNQSILMETIQDMKKERELLFQLLTNLTLNQKKDETKTKFVKYQIRDKHSSSIPYKQNPTPPRFKSNYLQPIRTELPKPSLTTKKHHLYKTIASQDFETKPFRHYDIQLQHSQNSPFKHYRSQSLQDLT